MIAPRAVIDQARAWVGVPFLHQGRTRNGADCLGFIAACLNELGSDIFLRYLPTNYARAPQSLLIDGMMHLTRQIDLEPAALMLIQFPLQAHPAHAAIYTGESMIHTDQMIGRVVEHSYGGQWVARTKSIWAIPLVTY